MRWLSGAMLVAIAAACSGGRAAPPSSAPSTKAAASCSSCHAPIAAEWRGSFHRVSFSDVTFQTSLAIERPKDRPFCVRCHAPGAEQRGTADGVDCIACHAAPHTLRTRTAGSSVCSKCHEFAFDDSRAELAQKTVTEHADSKWSDMSCTECHMKKRDTHTDHRFVAGHAPDTLRRAVHVTAERAGNTALRVAIRVDAGHAFPTGDMFRRARLMVFAEDARGRIVADAERVFGRTWDTAPDGARREASDTRIRSEWTDTIALEAPDAPIVRVRWSLLYERVVAVRGPHVSLASSDAVADGDLAW